MTKNLVDNLKLCPVGADFATPKAAVNLAPLEAEWKYYLAPELLSSTGQ